MKQLAILLFALLIVNQIDSQEKDIKTHSVLIDDLISFTVNTFDVDDSTPRNITFLIQTRNSQMSPETSMILKQGFKLISERLSEDSQLSLVTYTYFNGLALEPTNSKELKLILHTLDDLKSNISEQVDNGMDLAYKLADTYYDESYENLVVMIRNNEKGISSTESDAKSKKEKRKQKTEVILGIAISVLPELISAIKD